MYFTNVKLLDELPRLFCDSSCSGEYGNWWFTNIIQKEIISNKNTTMGQYMFTETDDSIPTRKGYQYALQCHLEGLNGTKASPGLSTYYIILAYFDIAELNLALGNFKEAIVCIDNILQLDTLNIEAHRMKGTILGFFKDLKFYEEETEAAYNGLDEALRFNKTAALFHLRLLIDKAVAREATGAKAEAEECLQLAIGMDLDASVSQYAQLETSTA
jgi:tetratricopeptide (TPR) repeat protein